MRPFSVAQIYMVYDMPLRLQERNSVDLASLKDFIAIACRSGRKKDWLYVMSLDVSGVNNMKHLFYRARIPAYVDLSQWDVSQVTDMSCMFEKTVFESSDNIGIDKWDVSSLVNIFGMFSDSNFSGCLNNWDIRNINDFQSSFWNCCGQYDISKWKPDFSKSGISSLSKKDIQSYIDTSRNNILRKEVEEWVDKIEGHIEGRIVGQSGILSVQRL